MYVNGKRSITPRPPRLISRVQQLIAFRPSSWNPMVHIFDTARAEQPPRALFPSTHHTLPVLNFRSMLLRPTMPAGAAPSSPVYSRRQ